jgi:hypothetical protein
MSDKAFDLVTVRAKTAAAATIRTTVVRAVETQHVAATMRLVGSAEAQAVLEAALEASKPPVPPGCERLDYLLYTPFRYPPTPWPSRFRGPTDPGVFYAAERARTALAEVAHWRLEVLLDAVELHALEPTAHTLFAVRIEAAAADASELGPRARRQAVLDPNDYAAAQAWGREVRAAGFGAIRYPAVRDRPEGVCWALLTPSAFRSKPALQANWLVRITRQGAQCRSTTAPFASVDFAAAQLLCREEDGPVTERRASGPRGDSRRGDAVRRRR